MSVEYQEYHDILQHFPIGLSDEIQQYMREEVFQHSRYIFTRREGKQQYGYCTHCRTDFKVKRFRHNDHEYCPNCRSVCVVKASGRSRKKMIDEAYFVYYEKSLINPQAIIARGIYSVRDYTDNYRDVQTQYVIKAYYLFELGSSTMLKRYTGYGHYYSNDKKIYKGSLEKCKSVFCLYTQVKSNGYGGCKDIVTTCSRASIANAVQNTPFRFSTWDQYCNDDMVKFFGLYAKYPCIEYLTKLGFGDLVETKLMNGYTYGAINWRGKTLMQVLRLNKAELKEIKEKRLEVTPLFLRLLQITKRDNSNFSMDEIQHIADKVVGSYFNDMKPFLAYGNLRKITAYAQKQFEQQPEKKYYWQIYQVFHTWHDYLKDCEKLQLDITREQVLFPKNLYRAHQNTIRQIKLKADAAINAKIVARQPALKRYCFTSCGLFIRPAASMDELIAEGKALHHCVGMYAERYAKGDTDILLIRKIAKSDKPYFTVEIKNGQVIQCRGKNNCNPGEDVDNFMKAFAAEKLAGNHRQAVPA